jgi:hypothetical protein
MLFNSRIRSLGFYVLWVISSMLILRATVYYRVSTTNDFSLNWIYESILLLSIVQGLLLCTKSWKFIWWIPISVIAGCLGFWVGTILFIVSIVTIFPPGFGMGVGGAVLGFAQWAMLRKFSKAYVLIISTALAYWIAWTSIVHIYWFSQDQYFDAQSLSIDNFVWMVTIKGVLLGLLQALGLFYVFNSNSPDKFKPTT